MHEVNNQSTHDDIDGLLHDTFRDVGEGLSRDHEVESEPSEEANIPGKSRDHNKARLDFLDLGIKPHLQPYPSEDGSHMLFLPAPYAMSNAKKDLLLKVLKETKLPYGYASNIGRSNPEASIAEGYMMEECLKFISRYLREDVNTRLDRRCARNFSLNQHDDELSLFPKLGHLIGGKRNRKGKGFTLDFQSLKQAHRYIVFNCDNATVKTYIKEHQIWVNSQGRKRRWNSAQSHSRDFIDWFFEKVQRELVNGELFWLAKGPNPKARRMTNNGSKKPEIASKSTLAPYEKVRSMTIERNAQRIRELGLDKIAQQLLEKNKNFAKGKENVNSNVDDQDYVPDEENCDLDEELEMSREATTSIPKKKARTREQPPRKNKKQPLYPSMAMENFLVAQNQMDPAELREVLLLRIRQNMTACVDQRDIASEVSTTVGARYAGVDVVPKKKGRGPTNLFDVHARKWEDRVAIYCNDKGQAIGPEKARKELTRFLGTIAHDYNWAPLTYTNWKQVPNKEKIWEFMIQAMRELEASQDDQSGEPVKDPFDEVMRNIRRGIELLQGLGVTRKKRKDKGPEFAKEKEVHAAKVAAQEAEIKRKTKELESKTLKLQEIRMDFENQQGNITLDAIISALAQL
uniref:Uncharacterized protein n=1 Tax=Chenopodium quinoa TaxID=63459 RepID=A0A803MY38_CHEQI